MRWECIECGCRVIDRHHPESCPECGDRHAIFERVEMTSDWEPGGGSLRDYWFELGLRDLRRPTFELTPSPYS